MAHSIREIAQALGARHEGDGALTVTGAAEPARAGPDNIAMAMEPKYAEALAAGGARAAVLWAGADWQAMGLEAAIFVDRPRFAMAGVTRMFSPDLQIADGIHPSAVIDPSADIAAGAAIGPFCWVGPDAVLGAHARLVSHVSIGAGARIGPDALIHSGARIGARVTIGARFIAQPGAVIGGDGFSFVTPEEGAVEQVRKTLGQRGAARQGKYVRIDSLGAVRIGDDVEVGANVAIDRGTLSDTVIGNGTKIDNLVQIGHNVRIGEDCLLCGQTGIAGSTVIGDRVVFAGQVGVGDHLEIGDDVIAGGGSGILSSVPSGRVLLGYPAMKMDQSIESYKAIRRLPRLMKQVAALQKRVSKGPQSD